MNITGRKILVLGGSGLVGIAVCRELLGHQPSEIRLHSLRLEESEQGRQELLAEAGDTELSISAGDILGLAETGSRQDNLDANLDALADEHLDRFLLYRLLDELRPNIVIDCVNTATAIAYRDVFRSASKAKNELAMGSLSDETTTTLLEALYVPRLIRHIQVLYRGMTDAGTQIYFKVGTSGTGGMGLNIPYTHSEERPSRVLLSKSALAGAHSMLLFLMARTPDAPITKEIKPAAAIAWKRIGFGPIRRRGEEIRKVTATPHTLGSTFSTFDSDAAIEHDETIESVFIDTGENGIFSLEEFAALTTAEQMEFVTPEEIASYLVFEIEGGNTGHDVMNALDNAVLGPTYRAGLLRHWALERMIELEKEHETHSVAFEALGPPRLSKLLFEAHLLRLAFVTMSKVRDSTAEVIAQAIEKLLAGDPDIANRVVAFGIPILLSSGEILRSQKVIVPSDAEDVEVTPERLEGWVHDGWVDFRHENCQRWIDRFRLVHEEIQAIPEDDSSSRHMRNRRFWDEAHRIQPGKIVGWIFSEEEKGGRFKG